MTNAQQLQQCPGCLLMILPVAGECPECQTLLTMAPKPEAEAEAKAEDKPISHLKDTEDAVHPGNWLFHDHPIPSRILQGMRRALAPARKLCSMILDDRRSLLMPGETWYTGALWESAAQDVPKDPIMAAAMILELADAENLLLPDPPEPPEPPLSEQEAAARKLRTNARGFSEMPVLKPSFFDFGMGYLHDMPCAVYSEEHAYLAEGVFQPSQKAQGEGWRLHRFEPEDRIVKANSWWARLLLCLLPESTPEAVHEAQMKAARAAGKD